MGNCMFRIRCTVVLDIQQLLAKNDFLLIPRVCERLCAVKNSAILQETLLLSFFYTPNLKNILKYCKEIYFTSFLWILIPILT
jgi:hypothetical protein